MGIPFDQVQPHPVPSASGIVQRAVVHQGVSEGVDRTEREPTRLGVEHVSWSEQVLVREKQYGLEYRHRAEVLLQTAARVVPDASARLVTRADVVGDGEVSHMREPGRRG